jgi:hypothetical protein
VQAWRLTVQYQRLPRTTMHASGLTIVASNFAKQVDGCSATLTRQHPLPRHLETSAGTGSGRLFTSGACSLISRAAV